MESLFEIGQKVVCVNSSPFRSGFNSPPLIEGRVYTINAIIICQCKSVYVDVGFRDKNTADFHCIGCSNIRRTPIHYCSQYRFVPLDDDRALYDEIRESLNLHLIDK